jgi:hypothetical protein
MARLVPGYSSELVSKRRQTYARAARVVARQLAVHSLTGRLIGGHHPQQFGS